MNPQEIIESIRSYTIQAGKSGPYVLLTAGVHGDEYEPMLAALELIPLLSDILIAGTVTIVPVVNTTAYQRGNRLGSDNLDLARICPGKQDGTPSERNAFEVSELIKTADYLVDMHTGGLAFDIFPLAGYMLHPREDILEQQRTMALAFNLPVIWGTDHLPEGRTLSVARDHHVPAIYLEYGGGTGIREETIYHYRDGFINLLSHLKMAKGKPVFLPEEERYWVEDGRPDSGYFQGKMPSPAEDVFVAEVVPGDQVKKGELFGRVIHPLHRQTHDIVSDMDGIVLSVRVLPHVIEGDALGSILPLTQPGKISIH